MTRRREPKVGDVLVMDDGGRGVVMDRYASYIPAMSDLGRSAARAAAWDYEGLELSDPQADYLSTSGRNVVLHRVLAKDRLCATPGSWHVDGSGMPVRVVYYTPDDLRIVTEWAKACRT